MLLDVYYASHLKFTWNGSLNIFCITNNYANSQEVFKRSYLNINQTAHAVSVTWGWPVNTLIREEIYIL